MGVFRAIMGGLIFINFGMISIFYRDWFSESGYTPAWVGAQWIGNDIFLSHDGSLRLPHINLMYGQQQYWILVTFNVLVILFALLTTLGLYTRISSILLAIGIITFHHRNPTILHGGDTVMRVSAMYMAIAPSGAAFSLDRLFAVRRGVAPIIPPLVSMWPQRLIAYNCALIYLTTVWAKLFGVLWRGFVATWYPARLHEFDRFPVPGFMNEFPMVYLSTGGTIFTEFALGTLVWFKALRKWVLLAGLMMHGYIEYSMNIPLFGYLMATLYLSYYEGEEVAAWFDRLKARLKKKPVAEAA